MTKKVNWLIAHKPVNLFIRTAKAFAKEIYEVTKGEYEIVIHEKESEEKTCSSFSVEQAFGAITMTTPLPVEQYFSLKTAQNACHLTLQLDALILLD